MPHALQVIVALSLLAVGLYSTEALVNTHCEQSWKKEGDVYVLALFHICHKPSTFWEVSSFR